MDSIERVLLANFYTYQPIIPQFKEVHTSLLWDGVKKPFLTLCPGQISSPCGKPKRWTRL